MKLIESKAEYIPQKEGIDGIYKQIELAGRTCYKSEDKITEDSAKGFVERMIKSNHTAMLEHGTVYLKCKICLNEKDDTPLSKYKNNKYSTCYEFYFPAIGSKGSCVTTNYRVIVENNWFDDLIYLCEPTELHERRYTFRFTTDRGVSHELVRHRVFSFAQESTRYCNYTKGKFGSELTFIVPSWYDTFHDNVTFSKSDFINYLTNCECWYEHAISAGLAPQEARAILPNCLKTEICMTGFASDWKYFFDLRYFGKTGAPHPDMKILASKAKVEAEHNKIWDDIVSHKSKFE